MRAFSGLIIPIHQNWQINEIRKYFDGQLDILYPGKGFLCKQIMAALTNELTGDGWSEELRALYADHNPNQYASMAY